MHLGNFKEDVLVVKHFISLTAIHVTDSVTMSEFPKSIILMYTVNLQYLLQKPTSPFYGKHALVNK